MNVTIISDSALCDYADIAVTLAKALCQKNTVNLIIPYYENEYDRDKYDFKELGRFEIRQGSRSVTIEALYFKLDRINCYLISNSYFFSRTKRHGYADEAERSAVFCNSALELYRHLGVYPHYVFSIGCFCALIPIYLKLNFSCDDCYRSIKSFHLINDKRYGIFDKLLAQNDFGIYPSNTHIVTASNEINLTKGAIVCANRIFIGEGAASILKDINSPCHSALIQFGFKIRKLKLGIDYSLFDTENENEILSPFYPDNTMPKEDNKNFILHHYGFDPKPDIPLILLFCDKRSCISDTVIENILKCNVYLVVISASGTDFKTSETNLRTETSLSLSDIRNLFSGADFSVFASPGQNSLSYHYISCAYACVPIVPFCDYFDNGITYFNKITMEGNGFTYNQKNRNDLLYTLWDAIGIYRHNPKCFYKLRANCMKKQFPASDTAKQIESEADKSINISF